MRRPHGFMRGSVVMPAEAGLIAPTIDEPLAAGPAGPEDLVRAVHAGLGIKEAQLTPAIGIDASYLPGALHGDLADRLIVATARHLGMPVATRDSGISAYAAGGHADVIAC